MAESFSLREVLDRLRDPNPAHGQEALRAFERSSSADTLNRFRQQAKELQLSIAIDLCAVLGHGSSPAVVGLLGDYAQREDAGLRERALNALQRIAPAIRMDVLIDLLDCDFAEVRREVCRMLGASANEAPRSGLVERLEDDDAEVVLAALGALQRLDIKDSAPEVATLLRHHDPRVRREAIQILVPLATESHFPAERLARLVADDADDEVRGAACWAFGRRPFEAGLDALRHVMMKDESPVMRAAAAAALGSYDDEGVIHDLIVRAATDRSADVAINCRRALNRMPPETTLAVCGGLLGKGEGTVRMQAAAILGTLSDDGACSLLLKFLHAEKDALVRAAIVEALGNGGWPRAWKAIMRCVEEEATVAFAAVAALGLLLDAEHVMEYAMLIDRREENTIRETVLKRLALYGRGRELPESVVPLIRPFFKIGSTNLAMLSAEVLACVPKPGLARLILGAMAQTEEPALVEAYAKAAMILAKDSAYNLLKVVGAPRMREVQRVLEARGEVGRHGRKLCLMLARLARQETKGALECLDAAGIVDPEAMAAAIRVAEEEDCAILVRAWSRHHVSAALPFEQLFGSRSAEVRLAALEALPDSEGEGMLRRVVDLALLDDDEAIREAARVKTKTLVEA